MDCRVTLKAQPAAAHKCARGGADEISSSFARTRQQEMGQSIDASIPPQPDALRAPAPKAPPASTPAPAPLRLQPRRGGWAALDLRELWAYRELLAFQAMRDIK